MSLGGGRGEGGGGRLAGRPRKPNETKRKPGKGTRLHRARPTPDCTGKAEPPAAQIITASEAQNATDGPNSTLIF